MFKIIGLGLALGIVAALLIGALPARAHDDGRFAGSPLKAWFDRLANQNHGLCCSFADGRSVSDPDWGTEAVASGDKTEIRYWVVVDGQRLSVPPEAVVTDPNRFGQAVVWPWQSDTYNADGSPGKPEIHIRCFLPGAGT